MRIAYLSNSIIPSHYANSVQVMKMCQAFAHNGHEVTLFARQGSLCGGDDDYQRYGVEPCFQLKKLWRPHMLFSRKTRLCIYMWQLRRCLRKRSTMPDLLYGRDVNSFLALLDWGIPMVYEAHYAPAPEKKKVYAQIFGSPHLKRVVVISQIYRNAILRQFPQLPAEKILVVNNAADMPCVSAEPAVPWPGRPGCLQIGYVGQLYPKKGMEIISQLAPLLADMDFHIVGGTPKDITAWRRRCRFANVHFHGFVTQNDLGRYYARFDVVLAPYNGVDAAKAGASPLKLFEYMAYRKPIVASDLPMIREVLCHRGNALLVPSDQIRAWVEALRALSCDSSLRVKLAATAYQDFVENYTWTKRAQRVLAGLE